MRTSYKKEYLSEDLTRFFTYLQGVAQDKCKLIVIKISYEFLVIILRTRPTDLSVVKLKLRIIAMFVIVDMGTIFKCNL